MTDGLNKCGGMLVCVVMSTVLSVSTYSAYKYGYRPNAAKGFVIQQLT